MEDDQIPRYDHFFKRLIVDRGKRHMQQRWFSPDTLSIVLPAKNTVEHYVHRDDIRG